MHIKTISPLYWRASGYDYPLRLVVIRPLGYRIRKNSRILYRQPAYLIITDPDISVEKAVKAYVWRWDIEVNFRDEKQLLGTGQAQVRAEESVESAPSMSVASYAMLLIAATKAYGTNGAPDTLPPAKWRRNRKKQRASTSEMISLLRHELWGRALGVSDFSGFMTQTTDDTKPEKCRPHLASAALYATG